jgi:outer membrane receptor protein involved in Fe transport
VGTFEGGAAELRNFIPKTINAGFSYRARGWEARAAWNYTAAFLFAFNANPLLRQYKESGDTFDVNLQYRFRPWLTAFVDVVNIFNETPNVYMARDPRKVFFSEVFGARLTVGVSGRF